MDEFMRQLQVHDLGRIGYDAALTLQRELLARVTADDDAPGYLLLLEHDPAVITLGRRGRDRDVLPPREKLDELGIEVHESTRGGEVTYHGPGQLVAYAIHRLYLPELGVRDHVRGLEEAVIRTAAEYGVECIRGDSKSGTTGVWTKGPAATLGEKLAAIGVAVRRWVTYHGLALNVCTDLSRFDLIVPCGLTDKTVTSLRKLLRRDVNVEDIKPKLTKHFAAVFGYDDVQQISGNQ
jgi:lipoyl(octanoyl) transferase